MLRFALGLIGFGIMVFVHELGHFLAAKRVGIAVETFSLGWGKRLVGFRRKGTDYRISLIPFGGFCKMKGEDPLGRRGEPEQGSFFSAAPWKRIVVSVAGPLSNLAFAVLVLSLIWWAGFTLHSADNRIVLATDFSQHAFLEPPPATRAGLRTGDRVVAIEGQVVQSFQDIQEAVATSPDKALRVEVLRDGERLEISLTPELDRDSGAGLIGVYDWVDPVIGKVARGSAAAVAGLRPGDRIVAAAGAAATAMTDTPHAVAFGQVLVARPPNLRLRLERDGALREATLIPTYDERGRAELGFTFRRPEFPSPRLGPLAALGRGLSETWQNVRLTVRGIGLLFRGVNFRNAVAGPLRIIDYVGTVAASGFSESFAYGVTSSLRFLCLLSIVLFLMNLLPVPGLDGGQILVYSLEAARRRPLNPKAIARIQVVGFSFIFALAVLVTFNDILSYLGR